MKRRWLLAVSLLIAGTTPAPAARAYVRSRTASGIAVAWDQSCVKMVVHNSDIPAPLTPAIVLAATSAAGAAWGREEFTCTPLRVTTTATSEPAGPATNDGVNRVMFRRDKWCRVPADPAVPCYDPAMLAVTTLTSSVDGVIIDADIEVNAVDHSWDDLVKNPMGAGEDLESALVHEFGHLIGLAHTCWDGTGKTRPIDNAGKLVPACGAADNVLRATVMFPTTMKTTPIRRVLAHDDATAVCQIYAPNPNIPGCLVPRDGGAPDVHRAVARDAGASGAADAGGAAEAPGCSVCSMGGGAAARPFAAAPLGFGLFLAILLHRRRRQISTATRLALYSRGDERSADRGAPGSRSSLRPR